MAVVLYYAGCSFAILNYTEIPRCRTDIKYWLEYSHQHHHNKSKKDTWLLRRHLRCCSPATKETAYKALVRPQMEYYSAVWDPYEKGDSETLEKVQRRAARFVKRDYRQQSSVTQMIKDLGWQSLQEWRAVKRLTLMYKTMRGLSEVQFSNLIRKRRTTRSASVKGFRNVRSNKSCYCSSFLPRTIPKWNNLPDKIRNAPSLDNFKIFLTDQINIKDFVQSSHYYS